MDIFAGVFGDRTEENQILFTDRITEVSFGTALPGGFADASFKLSAKEYSLDYLYRRLLAKHLLLGDRCGRRLWEGEIVSVGFDRDFLTVQAVGYYARLNKILTFLAYVEDVTPTQLITDAMGLIDDYVTQQFKLVGSNPDSLGPQIFGPETKAIEMLNKALSLGYGASQLPGQFAIYNQQLPIYGAAPLPILGSQGWHISSDDMKVTLGGSKTTDQIFNRIQVIFDDNGQQETDWFEDLQSQSLYGIREGSINVGATLLENAQNIGELAIKMHAYPTEAVQIEITGGVRSFSGLVEPLYLVRAGTYIDVDDLPADINGVLTTPVEVQHLMVTRTSYTADQDTLSVEVGMNKLAFETWVTNLGLSGSIQ